MNKKTKSELDAERHLRLKNKLEGTHFIRSRTTRKCEDIVNDEIYLYDSVTKLKRDITSSFNNASKWNNKDYASGFVYELELRVKKIYDERTLEELSFVPEITTSEDLSGV